MGHIGNGHVDMMSFQQRVGATEIPYSIALKACQKIVLLPFAVQAIDIVMLQRDCFTMPYENWSIRKIQHLFLFTEKKRMCQDCLLQLSSYHVSSKND